MVSYARPVLTLVFPALLALACGCSNSRFRCDWRVLANGRLDRALYESGRLDRTLSFPVLRRSAYLNEIANSAPESGFGDYVRKGLESRRHDR